MFSHLMKNNINFFNSKRYFAPILIKYHRNLSENKNIEINLTTDVKTNKQLTPITYEKPKSLTLLCPDDISHISGMPKEHIKERFVRIYCSPKNAMQSGTNNVGVWEMEFDTRSKWENPLMGWLSGGDPNSNVKVQFSDKKSAIQYAEKNGYTWYVEYDKKNLLKTKSYGVNFSWNKRTRVSTK